MRQLRKCAYNKTSCYSNSYWVQNLFLLRHEPIIIPTLMNIQWLGSVMSRTRIQHLGEWRVIKHNLCITWPPHAPVNGWLQRSLICIMLCVCCCSRDSHPPCTGDAELCGDSATWAAARTVPHACVLQFIEVEEVQLGNNNYKVRGNYLYRDGTVSNQCVDKYHCDIWWRRGESFVCDKNRLRTVPRHWVVYRR